MSTTARTLNMASILTDRTNRVVVCCGAGGVGKTTTAAAMALRAAEHGRRRRGADDRPGPPAGPGARCVKELGNTPSGSSSSRRPGELHAMMLDMRRTFDDMVLEHSEPGRAEQILANPFYQTVATSFSGHSGVHGDGEAGPGSASAQMGSRCGLYTSVTQCTGFPGRSANGWVAFLDGRCAPSSATGPAWPGWYRARGLAMKGVSTIVGCGCFRRVGVRSVVRLDIRWFPGAADRTYELLRRRGTEFVVSLPRSRTHCARRRSLSIGCAGESMPLAGLVLNRTHPTLCALAVHAVTATDKLEAEEIT